DPDDEHDIVDAAGDGHRADAKRIRARRARVLDACARDAGEAERSGDGVAADAFLAPQRAPLGRDERGLDLLRLETLVDAPDRGVERAGGHLLVALLEQLAHLDEPGADDCNPIPAHELASTLAFALKPYTGTPRSCAYLRSTSSTRRPSSMSVPSP